MGSRPLLRHRPWQTGALVTSVAALGLALLPGEARAAPGKCDAGIFDLACEVGKTTMRGATNVVTAPVEAAAGAAVNQVTGWVANAAVDLIGKVVKLMNNVASPELTGEWFADSYELMFGVGLVLILPMLIFASIRALMHQDAGELGRAAFMYLPAAIVLTFIAIEVTQLLIAAVDQLSAYVSQSVGKDATRVFTGVGGVVDSIVGGGGGFLVFFGALIIIIASFILWIALFLRSVGIYVCVFFLPLAFAGLVWPGARHWARKLVEMLVTLILAKFVIVAMISLAARAIAPGSGGGGVGTVVAGAVILLLAAFSPYGVYRLLNLGEAAVVSNLEGLSRRPVTAARHGGSSIHSLVRERMSSERSWPSQATGSGGGTGILSGGSAATGAGAASVAATVASAKGAAEGADHKVAELMTSTADKSPGRTARRRRHIDRLVPSAGGTVGGVITLSDQPGGGKPTPST
jgi:hypothetical protein